SRRRHTRSKRDWSSDVCSSDLHFVIVAVRENRAAKSKISEVHALLDAAKNSRLHARQEATQASETVRDVWVEFDETLVDDLQARSEERRVGQECGGRGATDGER